MTVEKQISALVENQFPSFYKDEGENFIAFTKAYYEWLEQTNNAIIQARSLLEYRDVDTTLDEFIVNFKEKYLKNIEFESVSNKRLLLKNSLDIYRAKGTDRSIDLLFKLIYGTGAEVNRPGKDIFRLSDGEWIRPIYMEITNSPKTIGLVGKQITGVTSGATAFVEKYIKRRVKDNYIYILSISNVRGTFLKNELLKADTVYEDLPTIVGSMTHVTIEEGGSGFEIGDIVTVVSPSGDYGRARVSNTINNTGAVDFLFVDGGYGYTVNADIHISEVVLRLGNVSQVSNQSFTLFETVTQPLSNVSFTGAVGTFESGEDIFSTTGTGVGKVLEANQTGTTGWLLISRHSGTFTSGTVYNTGNTHTGTISAHTNLDKTGDVIQVPEKVQVQLLSNTGIFLFSEAYQGNSTVESANGVVSKIANSVVTISNVNGIFLESEQLKFRSSSTIANIQALSMELALYNLSGDFIATNDPLIRGDDDGPEAIVLTISAGEDASFDLSGIEDTETIYLNTDLVGDYTAVELDAAQYGFPKDTTANVSDYLFSTLTYNPYVVGRVSGITNISPGDGYTSNPEILIQEQLVYQTDRKDYWLILDDTTLSFQLGEAVTQNTEHNFYDLTVSSNTGWVVNEYVYTGTYPTVDGSGNIDQIVDNIIRVSNVTGTFTDGALLKSLVYTTNTSITTAVLDPTDVQASGEVMFANATHMRVRRLQFDNRWSTGNRIHGVDTGASANVLHTGPYANALPIGLNANVEANVITSNGSVTSLAITDSGFAYYSNQQVTFISTEDINQTGSAVVGTSAVGRGSGYFKSTKGFLSDDKYLFDGDYYQEYSYEVLSRLPFDRYSEMLKKVLHVAGTKSFGSVVISSEKQAANLGGTSDVTQFNYYPILTETKALTVTGIDTNLVKAP